MEGSVVDLGRIGLGGLRSIRVIRSVGELRIELGSVFTEGGRPYSLIEAGTGDLNSNLFRGTFSHPRALGGVVALSMERVDTRGPRGQEPGVSQGAGIRYARALPARGALLFDFSSRSVDREGLYYPPKASRSDWSLRTRWDLVPGLVGDLYYASSSVKTEEPDTFAFDPVGRTQLGALLSYDSRWVRGSGQPAEDLGRGPPILRPIWKFRAPGVPRRSGGGIHLGELGGKVLVPESIPGLDGPAVGALSFRGGRLRQMGATLSSGVGGPSPESRWRNPPPFDTFPATVPGPRFGDMSGSRYGAQFEWKGLSLAGARLKTEVDSLFPLGLATDREGTTQAGGSREGFELSARVPLYPDGFALVGWWQKWDQAEDVFAAATDSAAAPELLPEDQMPWRYLPSQSYQASLSFHNTFLPTENLEVWFDLGVQGPRPHGRSLSRGG